jgi:hypothetical protein
LTAWVFLPDHWGAADDLFDRTPKAV